MAWRKRKSFSRKSDQFRSGLEGVTAEWLRVRGVEFKYESFKIEYSVPEKVHKYTPDFLLPNGIIIETKGIFDSADRAKHILIKAQHPEYDIRFVFSNSSAPLYKGSPTTYAGWCRKYGFKYADRVIPEDWIKEPCQPSTSKKCPRSPSFSNT